MKIGPNGNRQEHQQESLNQAQIKFYERWIRTILLPYQSQQRKTRRDVKKTGRRIGKLEVKKLINEATNYFKKQKKIVVPDENYAIALKDGATQGAHELVQGLLDKVGTKLPLCDKENALNLAAQHGHFEVVKVVLERDGEFISADVIGAALRSAAFHGDLAVVRVLLSKSKNISSVYLGIALRNAALYGHVEVVNELYDQKEDVISSDDKRTALLLAIQYKHVAMVCALLEKAGDNFSSFDYGNALISAAADGQLELVRAILVYSKNKISSIDVGSALRAAQSKVHLPIIEALITHKGINISIYEIVSLLEYAAEHGHIAIIHKILAIKGEYISDEDKAWLLVCAARCGDLAIVQYFYDQVGIKTFVTKKALAVDMAAERGHHVIAYELLSKERPDFFPINTKVKAVQTLAQALNREVLSSLSSDTTFQDKISALYDGKSSLEKYARLISLMLNERTVLQAVDRTSEAVCLIAQMNSISRHLDCRGLHEVVPDGVAIKIVSFAYDDILCKKREKCETKSHVEPAAHCKDASTFYYGALTNKRKA